MVHEPVGEGQDVQRRRRQRVLLHPVDERAVDPLPAHPLVAVLATGSRGLLQARGRRAHVLDLEVDDLVEPGHLDRAVDQVLGQDAHDPLEVVRSEQGQLGPGRRALETRQARARPCLVLRHGGGPILREGPQAAALDGRDDFTAARPGGSRRGAGNTSGGCPFRPDTSPDGRKIVSWGLFRFE